MKKYLPYILIVIVALGVFLGPKTTHAVGFWDMVDKGFSYFPAAIGSMAFLVCNWVLAASGFFFDAAINVSINNSALQGSGLVEDGWRISRDLANLCFIFILIYIGIATILQISGYGVKELLVKVIIIALLVNFSLIISQTVISASNVLAQEFYNNIKPSANVSLSETFVSGIEPQTVFPKTENTFQTGTQATMRVILTYLFACTISLVTAFTLFAGGIMFILRSVVLSILMILAPLAFVANILPKTETHFQDWFKRLFNQAFFAPAFLFMFYLVVKTIESTNGIHGILGRSKDGFNGFIMDPSNTAIFVNYVTLIILMLGCLQIAKIMGDKSASMGVQAANWTKGKLQGYAGNVGKFAARATVARAGEKYINPQLEKLTARSPVVGGWTADRLRKISEVGGRKEEIDQLVARGMTLSPKQRAEYLTRLGQGRLQDKKARDEMFRKMSARERVQLVEADDSFQKTYDKLTHKDTGALGIEEFEKTKKEYGKVQRGKDIGKLGKKDNAGAATITQSELSNLQKTISNKELSDISNKGGFAAETMFKHLNSLGGDPNTIAQALKTAGNKSAAAWALTPQGTNILDQYR